MPATEVGERIDSPTTPTSSLSKATPAGCATVTSAASPQPTPRPTSHQEPRRGVHFLMPFEGSDSLAVDSPLGGLRSHRTGQPVTGLT